jgi:diguanylate cyclase (GGDEF)-like protein
LKLPVESGTRLRVVIADDSADVRALLHHAFELDGRFEVVAAVSDTESLLAVVAEEHPHAVVLDLGADLMPSALEQIRRLSPPTRVLVLSRPGDDGPTPSHAVRVVARTTPLSELTDMLAGLAGGAAPSPQTLTPIVTDGVGLQVGRAGFDREAPDQTAINEADAAQRARDAGRSLRVSRWAGMVLGVIQFALYSPPPGVAVPFPRWPSAGLLVIALLIVNVVSLRAAGGSAARQARAGLIGVVVDSVVVMGVVWLFTFDATSALWALLVLPILEGAIMAGRRGALAVWAGLSGAYILRDVWGAHVYPDESHRVLVDSFTYRLGLLLIVALTTGRLAHSFIRQSEQHREARRDAEHRSELLRLVASAGRQLAALDTDKLLDAVADAAVALGFEGVELCVYDEATATWRGSHQRGMPDGYGRHPQPISSGIAGAVRTRRESVLVDDYSTWDGGLESLRDEGYRATVGTPIWAGEEMVAALIVGTVRNVTISEHELECVELLAAHAGVGLNNARLLERMRHQALHDALTGLPNQVLFEDRVNQALAQGGRTGERAAVLFLDLDRFKKVNDSLGHAAGNELLTQVAGRLVGAVRTGDTVARMGGDEFTLLLPGVQTEADASAVATNLLEAFGQPFSVGDHELFITASVGIALYPTDGARYETLLKHADIAMYRAKGRGGNVVELLGSRSRETAYPRLALEADLHAAIDLGQLHVVYQPILDLRSDVIVGVEALVRWRHPTLGLVRPDEFIPLAEESGLIPAVDAFVLRTACAEIVRWDAMGLPSMRLSVNISGRHLQHPRIVKTVLDALRASKLPGERLELEVTESVAVAETGVTRATLQRLRGAKVTVAIDDFGTGYSMLNRLRQMPLDTLKIDRSFVSEIGSVGDDAPIVTATIAMAHSLGLSVVAEGVETEAQLAYLRHGGCDLAQGYLIGHPAEAATLIELLAGTRPAASPA